MANKTMLVKASVASGHKVAFYEQHPAHPNGEAWVDGSPVADKNGKLSEPKPVRIGETARALQALASGAIERVEGGSAAAKEASETAEEKGLGAAGTNVGSSTDPANQEPEGTPQP